MPVDELHVRELAQSIKDEARSGARTGQLSAVLLAEIEGSDKFPIIDGFHRVGALASLGQEEVYCTIKTGATLDEVIDLRILTANTHKSVRFSRLVEWAEQAWDISPWADRMNISSAFTLRFLPSMTGGRSGISKEEAEEIRTWVDKKCEQWHVSAPYVHRFLQTAKVADPELVKEARERKSGHTLDAITPNHLGAIVKFLPDKYDLQRVVADTARKHALTVPQTRTVALAISRAKNVEEARAITDSESWRSLEAVYKPLTKKRYSKGKNKDMEGVGNHDDVLLDKFFDDQVAIAQLMVENAILIGRYIPVNNGDNKKINTLVATSDVALTEDEILGIENGAVHEWDPKKVTALFQTVDKLNPTLTNFLRRKGFRTHDAEDAVAVAVERFTIRVYDGRLPEEYIEEGKLQRLLIKMANYAGIDHLREEHGREGQKSVPISYTVDADDESNPLENSLALSNEETGYDTIDRKNVDFIKNLLPGLGERERRIMILKGYFGLSHYEIARVIGTTEGTINVGWHAIKSKVLKLTQESQEGPETLETVLLQN